MEKAIGTVKRIALPESFSFLVKSGLLLSVSGVILYLLLAATYPPIHDTLHNFRHSLAIVPCH
ncbi:MAG: CbtB domain-containing protein [Candidatus Binatia bacterium]